MDFGSVKNVGTAVVDTIVKNRKQNGEFKSFTDFCERMQGESVKPMPPQRLSIHRNISLKDYCIMAGLTLVSFPIGFYIGIYVIYFK